MIYELWLYHATIILLKSFSFPCYCLFVSWSPPSFHIFIYNEGSSARQPIKNRGQRNECILKMCFFRFALWIVRFGQ